VVILLAIVTGSLYAGGLYLMTRRSIVKLLIGIALLGHGANVLIFTAGRLKRGASPLVPADGIITPQQVADPLPQALILTAIVIGFGLVAFALTLLHRTAQTLQTDDIDEIRSTDR
jgi:multicomponent Na+:H+ antiporter subunit C